MGPGRQTSIGSMRGRPGTARRRAPAGSGSATDRRTQAGRLLPPAPIEGGAPSDDSAPPFVLAPRACARIARMLPRHHDAHRRHRHRAGARRGRHRAGLGPRAGAADRRRCAAARCSRARRRYLPFLDGRRQRHRPGPGDLHFPAPHSYTGEDVLELQAHGGPVRAAAAAGALPARPGSRALPACAWPSRASSPSAPSSTTSSTWRRPRPWPT